MSPRYIPSFSLCNHIFLPFFFFFFRRNHALGNVQSRVWNERLICQMFSWPIFLSSFYVKDTTQILALCFHVTGHYSHVIWLSVATVGLFPVWLLGPSKGQLLPKPPHCAGHVRERRCSLERLNPGARDCNISRDILELFFMGVWQLHLSKSGPS